MASSSNLLKDTVTCLSTWSNLGPEGDECGQLLVAEYTSFMDQALGPRARSDDAIAMMSFFQFLQNPMARQWAAIGNQDVDYAALRKQVAYYFQDVAYADPVSADIWIVQLLQAEYDEDVASILVSTLPLTVPGDPVTLNRQNVQSELSSIVQSAFSTTFSQGFIQQVQQVNTQLAPFYPNVPFTNLVPPVMNSTSPSTSPSQPPTPAPPVPPAPPAPPAPSKSWIPTAIAVVLGIGAVVVIGGAVANAGEPHHEAY